MIEWSDKILERYDVVKAEYLEDMECESWLLSHKKTGARIALLPNTDDNKVFYIGFRTPPTNSKGMAHIVEHTVLCGSRDFPVKDPFLSLAKGSLNTFLNAMTYPDKTVYPVASCNDTDFKNLMHVYLDAVFYPNIYREPNIFRQEGWHYEMEDPQGPITINGVVYNEMKGALSSPDDVIARSISGALYPHTPYAVESGGDPRCIPDLSYEEYLDFHRKYYHPSNSYIYLYGDMDMEERLLYLDEAYLSAFDRIQVDSGIPAEPAFKEPVEKEVHYSIMQEEDEAGKSYLSFNLSLAPDGLDGTLNLAFKVLDYVLCDAEGAPIRKALRDKGIGEDVYSMLDLGIRQPDYTIIAKNTDVSRKEEFISTIEETLTALAENGIDERALLAGINRFEFNYREASYGFLPRDFAGRLHARSGAGFYPKGLIYGLNALDTWLYDDGAAFLNMKEGARFEELRTKIGTGYFEQLIRTHMLDNPHRAIVVMTPQKGMTEKMAAELREKLDAMLADMSMEEREEIIREFASLRKWQETDDSEEDKAKIPMLQREDLGKEAKPYVNVVEEVPGTAGVKLIAHPLPTVGIDYLTFMFDISDLPAKFYPYLGIFKTVLGALDTENYSYSALDQEINIMTGGIGSTVGIYTMDGERDKYRLTMEITGKALDKNVGAVFSLVQEIAMRTKWRSPARIKEVLEEERAGMQAELISAGHVTALMRARSYYSKTGAVMESFSGITGYRTLDRVCRDMLKESEAARIEDILEEMAGYIFRTDHLIVDCTAEEQALPKIRGEIAAFCGALHPGQTGAEDLARYGAKYSVQPVRKQEGFTTAGQVQYVCRAGRFDRQGLPYSGAMRVLRVILSYEYLWYKVRMEGGAYGCMTGFSRDGGAFFVSYRDPHLGQTIDVYENAPAFIEEYEADERAMTQAVIGAVGTLDQPMTPPVYGKYSLTGYMTGLTVEKLQKERDELLSCTAEDIRALADSVRAFLDDDCLCVVGSDEIIRAESGRFDAVEKL